MDCSEFLKRLSAEGAHAPGLAEHARRCGKCRRLLPEPEPALPPGFADRLLDDLGPAIEPVTPLPSDTVLTLRLLALTGALLALGVLRYGAFGYRALGAADRVVLLGGLATALFALALAVPAQVIPGARPRRLWWLLGPAALSFLLSVGLGFTWMIAEGWTMAGLRCFLLGAGWGATLLAGAWWVLRRGVWTRARSGLWFGLLAATGGLAGLTFHCPILEASHILVWHLAPFLVLAALGYALGYLLVPRFGRR